MLLCAFLFCVVGIVGLISAAMEEDDGFSTTFVFTHASASARAEKLFNKNRREKGNTFMSDSRDSLLREQRLKEGGRTNKRGESIIYLVLRVREREHLLFALVPGFVHAWFSSTRDRVVFLFVRIVVLVVLRRRRGLQSSSSVRHDVVSLWRSREKSRQTG